MTLASASPSSTLGAARSFLTGLLLLNLLYGLGVVALLLASIVVPGPLFDGLGFRPAHDRAALEWGGRLVMLIGITSAPLTHAILVRLRAIVDTVRGGDPFVVDNATRLQVIAWALLGLELLHLAVGLAVAISPLDLDWSFSLTPWVAILLMFVLARVFDHGTRMRAELDATV